ncbi:hypothetical protein ACFB49_32010 [Sphingomonas sp. DBB INV C78]
MALPETVMGLAGSSCARAGVAMQAANNVAERPIMDVRIISPNEVVAIVLLRSLRPASLLAGGWFVTTAVTLIPRAATHK